MNGLGKPGRWPKIALAIRQAEGSAPHLSRVRGVVALVLAALLAAVTPALLAQNSFTRGPFVQNTTTNSLQLIWRTANPASTCVAYGLAPALDVVLTNSELVTNHVVTLTDLAPGTAYAYSAVSENEGGRLSSWPDTVRTLKTDGAISFEVISDTWIRRISTMEKPVLARGNGCFAH